MSLESPGSDQPGKLGTTVEVHPKFIEVDVLALAHANHPAQGLEVTHITPLNLTLTLIIIQRIIESGS